MGEMLAFSAANTEGYILCFTEDQLPAAAEDDAPSEMMTSSDYSVSHRGTYLPIKYFCVCNIQSLLSLLLTLIMVQPCTTISILLHIDTLENILSVIIM